MHANDWLQLALFLGILAAITKPVGIYLTRVLDPNGKTLLDPVIRPLERVTYRLMGTDSSKGLFCQCRRRIRPMLLL